MTYTHTSIPVELTEQAFCDDCGNPLPAGTLARRRVTDTGKQDFNIDWLCAGACGPIIDVSDDTLMRKRIAELEKRLAVSDHNRTMALELAQQSQDEAMDLAEELTVAERECDRLRERLDAARPAAKEVLRLIGRAICDIEADGESTPETDLLTQARKLLLPLAGIWI